MTLRNVSDRLPLNNGLAIPCVGFGTWKAPNDEVCVEAVREAVTAGYRHIDGAAVYGNETRVGEGIRASGVPRGELFVTSKVWNSEHGYDETLRAFERTLRDLGLDYLDLYLIHWPNPKPFRDRWRETSLATWRALERLNREGLARSIGLSNFLPEHLGHILAGCEIKPQVDQIEFHPGLTQWETVELCRANGILVEAYSPLGGGEVFADPRLSAIAAKYGRSVAQVVLRWVVQKGVVPLPKSVTPARIAENTRLFDFELSAEDCAVIDAFPEHRIGCHPDSAPF